MHINIHDKYLFNVILYIDLVRYTRKILLIHTQNKVNMFKVEIKR